MRIFMLGSNVFSKELINFLSDDICGYYLIGDCNDISYVSDSLDVELLHKKIIESNAEYVLVDFFYCFDPFLSGKGKGANDYDDLLKVLRKKYLMIFKDYPSEKIVIIRSRVAEYYVVNGRKTKKAKYKRLEDAMRSIWYGIEKPLISKYGFKQIDVTRCYYWKKKKGEKLCPFVYETECYLDITIKLNKYTNDNNSIKDWSVTEWPEFDLSLQRYIRYSDDFFNTQKCYFDLTDVLNIFVVSMPLSLAEEYYYDLIELHKIEYDDLYSLAHLLKINAVQNCNKELQNLFLAFLTVNYPNNIDREDYAEDYSIKKLFLEKVLSKEIIKNIQEDYSLFQLESKRQITRDNIGYYWAIQNGYSTQWALAMKKQEASIKPVLVDSFASCIGFPYLRERFGGSSELVANMNCFHTPIYIPPFQNVDYPDDLFDVKYNVHNEKVKFQFDGVLLDEINQSPAQWLSLDLYSLISPRTYSYKNQIYTDFKGTISDRLNAKNVSPWKDETILGDWNKFLSLCLPWCDNAKKKYGNNIIIVSSYHSEVWIGDDEKIYRWKNLEEIRLRNKFIDFALPKLQKWLGAYIVDYTKKGFLSDEIGYNNRACMHFEVDYYRCLNNTVRQIVKNEIDAKYINKIPPNIQIKRINRLKDNNPYWLLKKVLFNSKMDELVYVLPKEFVDNNYEEIISWYEKYDDSFQIIQNMETIDPRQNIIRKAMHNLDVIKNEDDNSHTIDELPYDYEN